MDKSGHVSPKDSWGIPKLSNDDAAPIDGQAARKLIANLDYVSRAADQVTAAGIANQIVAILEKHNVVATRARHRIPAVVHVDGSARVHSVHRETNPGFHSLIAEFDRLTGVAVVMNTSFNVKADPIVCSPKEAVQTFYTSGLDDLVIGSFIVSKTATGN